MPDDALDYASAVRDYNELLSQKARVEGEANQVRRSLTEAQKRSEALFGTSDPNELERQAVAIEAENAEKVTAFTESLAKVRNTLNAAQAAPAPRMG